MTLQEAKEQIAKDNGWENWNSILNSDRLSQESRYLLFDMAAIRYAKECKEDAEYWRKRYDSTQSMMDSYHRVGEDGWR